MFDTRVCVTPAGIMFDDFSVLKEFFEGQEFIFTS